jgi:hypothetical protein
MRLREKLGGEWWWTLNLVIHGMSGVLMSPLGRMGVGLWKNIRQGLGKFSSHTKFEV